MATKKTVTKKTVAKKRATKPEFKYVAVSEEGEFYACTEAPIFADGEPYWLCPDGHYASYGGSCCGKRSKETIPIAKIKNVHPLSIHLNRLVDDDSGMNLPYCIDYKEYLERAKGDRGDGPAKPQDVYRTAF